MLCTAVREAREARDARLDGVDAVTAPDLSPTLARVERLRRELTQESAHVVLEVRRVLTPERLARAFQIRQRPRQLQKETGILSGRPWDDGRCSGGWPDHEPGAKG